MATRRATTASTVTATIAAAPADVGSAGSRSVASAVNADMEITLVHYNAGLPGIGSVAGHRSGSVSTSHRQRQIRSHGPAPSTDIQPHGGRAHRHAGVVQPGCRAAGYAAVHRLADQGQVGRVEDGDGDGSGLPVFGDDNTR